MNTPIRHHNFGTANHTWEFAPEVEIDEDEDWGTPETRESAGETENVRWEPEDDDES